MNCPHCAAVVPDDDFYCQECGERLSKGTTALLPLCLCGALDGEVDEDGYCIHCGRRCRPAPGEHEEKQLSPYCAAVSDRGLRHARNEDRFQIATESGRCVIVVCDGVSNSTRADAAAAAASKRIAEALVAGASFGGAIKDACESVAQLADQSPVDSSPSTTVVAAAIENNQACIGWMGDSRAYWIAQTGSRQLTADHSWLNDVVSSGELSYAEAAKSPQAHGITRWIGPDGGPGSIPDIVTFQIPGPGWLLLCTDGLWNCAPEVEQLAGVVLAFPSSATALEIARHLIAYANEKGGSDNVTAALLRFT
jgi:PPM family protein phosphatase